MGKSLVKTKYKVFYSHAGFPTQSSGPYNTLEEATAEVDKYNGYGIKNVHPYIIKYETWAEEMPLATASS